MSYCYSYIHIFRSALQCASTVSFLYITFGGLTVRGAMRKRTRRTIVLQVHTIKYPNLTLLTLVTLKSLKTRGYISVSLAKQWLCLQCAICWLSSPWTSCMDTLCNRRMCIFLDNNGCRPMIGHTLRFFCSVKYIEVQVPHGCRRSAKLTIYITMT